MVSRFPLWGSGVWHVVTPHSTLLLLEGHQTHTVLVLVRERDTHLCLTIENGF